MTHNSRVVPLSEHFDYDCKEPSFISLQHLEINVNIKDNKGLLEEPESNDKLQSTRTNHDYQQTPGSSTSNPHQQASDQILQTSHGDQQTSETSYIAGDQQTSETSSIAEDKDTSDQTTIDRRCLEKCLTILFAVFLFLTAFGSGYIARVTLHILIWNIGPPMESNSNVSSLITFDGSMTPNCTACNVTTCQTTITTEGTWTWALVLVIIAPYVFTVLRCLWQLCFKRNKQPAFNKISFVLMTSTEVFHTVGLCILVFYILPLIGPILASVVYLATQFLTPFIGIYISYRNYRDETQKDTKNDTQKDTKNKTQKDTKNDTEKDTTKNKTLKDTNIETVSGIVGMILQVAGIAMLAYYLNDGSKTSLFLISIIFVSLKHWENVKVKKDASPYIWQLQNPQPKWTCVVYFVKVIFTIVTVIVINAIKSDDSTAGVKSLFNIGQSTADAIVGGQTTDCTCQLRNPFILCAINIVCDVLCYKSSKLACTINCQIVCFVIPLCLLPLLTTSTLPVIMVFLDVFKIGSCDILLHDWHLNSGSIYGLNMLLPTFIVLAISIILIAVPIMKDSGKAGRTGGVFVAPFCCGIFLELALLKNRRRNYKYVDINGNINTEDGASTDADDLPPTNSAPKGNENKQHFISQVSSSPEDLPLKSAPKKDENEVDAPNADIRVTSQVPNENENERSDILCVCCATMWHEEEDEMLQLLKSLISLEEQQRKKKRNKDETFDLEAHIFFDDAFIENKDQTERLERNLYVETLTKVVKKATKIERCEVEITPYGERLVYNLSAENQLVVHLKDKDKIRNKKRWSQVMYMRYILKYKHKKSNSKFAAKDIYILALDGDVKFKPEAFLSLMRRLKKSKNTGAACGRIHPIGSGPIVWYQKFEYAISHWLQKSTEHVIGCVLCSPGCFSLFRGSSLLRVIDTYSEEPSKPIHYLQYDQGEDRWLCTLLLKAGKAIEYASESHAKTFAPEGFYELYNQRRRWTPSTMANILDLLLSCKQIRNKNASMSVPYIVYHWCLFVSTLLTPGTIFMLIVGAIIVSFQWIHSLIILIVIAILVSVFLLMCIYASTQIQLQFAAILSGIFGIVMVIGLIGIIRDAVASGLCSITTIFILFVVGVFVISAILHLKEIHYLFLGLLYFFAIPSVSMLMFLYSIGNLHDVSWGTRDNKSGSDSTKSKRQEEMKEEKGYFCSFGQWCTCMYCPTNHYTKDDFIYESILNKWKYLKDDLENDNKENSDVNRRNSNTELKDPFEAFRTNEALPKGNRVTKKRKHIEENDPTDINEDEKTFWEETISEYLEPFHKGFETDSDQQKKYLNEKKIIEQKLIELRNQVCLFVFILNAILVTLVFSFTQVDVFTATLTIYMNCSGNELAIVPIAGLFVVVFGFLLLVQFICNAFYLKKRISILFSFFGGFKFG